MQISHLSDGLVRARAQAAMTEYGSDLRADSRQSPEPTMAARALIRQYATNLARDIDQMARAEGRKVPTDHIDGLRQDAVAAIAQGLKLRADDQDWIRDPGTRFDSATWYGRHALTAHGGIVPVAEDQRPVSATIPADPIEPWAETVLVEQIHESGHVAVVRPGQTELPVVGVGLRDVERKIHSFGNQTIMPWMAEIAAGRASFNPLAAQAEAARRAHDNFAEQLIIHGPLALSGGQPVAKGLDVLGLAQIPVPQYISSLDYSGAVTLDQVFNDLNGLLGMATAIRSVGGTSTLMLGTRIFRKIMGTSNYSTGGNVAGGDLLAALASMPSVVQQRFVNAGISTVVPAATLEGFRLGADYDGMVLLPNANSEAIRSLVALTPAPVYEYNGPHGRSTYWVQRHGGLGVRDPAGVVVGIAKVK